MYRVWQWLHSKRLCKSLRVAVRETETLRGKLAGAVSTKDWDALLKLMKEILLTENEVAYFISGHFYLLADSVRKPIGKPKSPAEVREEVEAFRKALIEERQQLIQQEIGLYEIV